MNKEQERKLEKLRKSIKKAEAKGNFHSAHHQTLAHYQKKKSNPAPLQRDEPAESVKSQNADEGETDK